MKLNAAENEGNVEDEAKYKEERLGNVQWILTHFLKSRDPESQTGITASKKLGTGLPGI